MFPQGDWYGNLRPEHVPEFIQNVIKEQKSIETSEFLRKHWRGRMGLQQEQAKDLYGRYSSADKRALIEEKPSSTKEVGFTTHEGQHIDVPASIGHSLMEIAKSAGLPSIEGVCEGKLEVRLQVSISWRIHFLALPTSAQPVIYTSYPHRRIAHPHQFRRCLLKKKTCLNMQLDERKGSPASDVKSK